MEIQVILNPDIHGVPDIYKIQQQPSLSLNMESVSSSMSKEELDVEVM